jgi:Zn-finger nucleic acid-binding protein
MSQHPGGLLCPACRVDLVMSERQGVEIDYCPRCRGVWLDRGELDKILERSAAELSPRAGQGGQPGAHPGATPPLGGQPYARPQGQPYAPPYGRHDSDEYPAHGHHGQHGHHKRKRHSFLDDLFDFG